MLHLQILMSYLLFKTLYSVLVFTYITLSPGAKHKFKELHQISSPKLRQLTDPNFSYIWNVCLYTLCDKLTNKIKPWSYCQTNLSHYPPPICHQPWSTFQLYGTINPCHTSVNLYSWKSNIKSIKIILK